LSSRGRRPGAGHGVPPQAHAAPCELQRELDLSRPHGQGRGLCAREGGPEVDPRPLHRVPLPGRGAALPPRAPPPLERIHILEGFRKVFNALDEAIRIIRAADGKADAGEKLKDRFKLDDPQADAILELRLYKLARLEIKAILDELKEKKARVAEIEALLASPKKRRLEIWCGQK
jgi:hypothetical protein